MSRESRAGRFVIEARDEVAVVEDSCGAGSEESGILDGGARSEDEEGDEAKVVVGVCPMEARGIEAGRTADFPE